MRRRLIYLGNFSALLGVALAAAPFVRAQGGPTTAIEGKTAGQVYKNIKVLNDSPADELNQAMHLIKGDLGVPCEYCHVEGHFDSDEKKPKETARKMMRMVMEINKNSFDSKQEVTCYTCHHGSPDPQTVPLLPVMEPSDAPKPTLPSIDAIISKYVDALGGEQAIRKITTRVITGTQYIPTGPGGTVPTPATIERDLKAPNLVLNTYHAPTYTIADGFDGNTSWSQDFRGRVSEAIKLDQERAKRDSDFYWPVDLKKEYAEMKVTGIEHINDHDTYVVEATPPGDVAERLYFDTQTGLLLRRWTAIPTVAGESPFETNYDDYRDTGSGVKFPFTITMYPAAPRTELAPQATIHVTKVQDNVPIDDSKFTKPQPKAPTQ